MIKQTQEALKMAIEWLDKEPQSMEDFEAKENAINACKEALEQPAPPEKTTSLEDVIKEFEKDPEMKALLDLARKQVKGMELEQPAQTYIVNNTAGTQFNLYEQPAQELVEIMDVMQYGQSFTKIAAEPAQEPVAWYWDNNHRDKIPYAGVERGNPRMDVIYGTPIPLYTHPHQWQGLTDDEIVKAFNLCDWMNEPITEFARAIEQALKEKNHG